MNKHLFQTIQNKLAEITELLYVDEDNGQFDQPKITPRLPAALVDIADMEFDTVGQRIGHADTLIKVRVAFKVAGSTSSSQPDFADNGWAHIPVLEQVTEKLNGLSGDNFNGLIKTRQFKEAARDPKVKIYTTEWGCDFTEVIGSKQWTKTPKPGAAINE